jgi:GTP-binding protein
MTEDEASTDVAFALPSVEGEEDDEIEPAYDETKPLRVAIVGRPNAGKSTLINRFLGEDRLLTGPEAGITRDSISVEWDWRGRTDQDVRYRRHAPQGTVQEKLEKLSVADALRAIRFAETWSSSSTRPSPSRSRTCRSSISCCARAAPPCSPSTSGI